MQRMLVISAQITSIYIEGRVQPHFLSSLAQITTVALLPDDAHFAEGKPGELPGMDCQFEEIHG